MAHFCGKINAVVSLSSNDQVSILKPLTCGTTTQNEQKAFITLIMNKRDKREEIKQPKPMLN